MRIGQWRGALVAAWVVVSVLSAGAWGQTSAFSYQGSLSDGGGAADGAFDLRFSVFAAEVGGGALGTVERAGVAVAGGVFGVELDFGAGVFGAGADRWLEIAVRPAGGGDYETLTPRTRIVGVPYATRAATAGVADFALDGPFAPADDTPRDSSGAPGSTVSAVLTLAGPGGSTSVPVGVILPISMENLPDIVNGDLVGGVPEVKPMEVWRLPVGSEWYDAYTARRAAVLRVTVRPAQGVGDTEYLFTGLEARGYRIERSLNGGSVEVLLLGQVDFRPNFERNNREADLSLLSAPLAGGVRLPVSGNAGPMRYSWPTAPEGLHSASLLPAEGGPTAGSSPSATLGTPFGMLVNALADHGVWRDFIRGDSRMITLENADGSVVWPRDGQPRGAIVTQWELRRAPDRGVYEAYILEVLAR